MLAVAAATLGGSGLAAGMLTPGQSRRDGDARLRSRPGGSATPSAPLPPGLHPLGLDKGRDGELYIPASYRADGTARLCLALHGAGGSGARIGARLRETPDTRNLVTVAPDSRGSTWDAIQGGFGEDIAFIDRALAAAFRHCAIAPNGVFVAGMSDGASYALSIGLANGDLFGQVVAYSPGFIVPAEHVAKPRFFVSHGTRDTILNIDRTSRRIVPALRAQGYDVEYKEFDGGHEITPDVRDASVRWLYGGR